MILGYSTNSARTDFREFINSQSLPAGSYYLEARTATPTVYLSLKKNGAFLVTSHTENTAPYDLDGGSPRMLDQGSYEFIVSDKTSSKTAAFTVGSIAPPPPTTKPVVTTAITYNPDEVQLNLTVNGQSR